MCELTDDYLYGKDLVIRDLTYQVSYRDYIIKDLIYNASKDIRYLKNDLRSKDYLIRVLTDEIQSLRRRDEFIKCIAERNS